MEDFVLADPALLGGVRGAEVQGYAHDLDGIRFLRHDLSSTAGVAPGASTTRPSDA